MPTETVYGLAADATQAAAVARVRVLFKVPCRSAREWRSGRIVDRPTELNLELAPGSVEFVELVEAAP